MKSITPLLAVVISACCVPSWAQDSEPADAADDRPPEIYTNPNAQPQQVFYKWYVGGKAHYGKYVPRGVSNYTKVNAQGMQVNERPNNDSVTVLRPMRPEVPAANSDNPAVKKAANGQPQPLPEGTITREKRCETAQTNLKTISEKKNIFEEDASGNLIPLTTEEIEKRRQQAQNDAEHFCGPAPAAQ